VCKCVKVTPISIEPEGLTTSTMFLAWSAMCWKDVAKGMVDMELNNMQEVDLFSSFLKAILVGFFFNMGQPLVDTRKARERNTHVFEMNI
jgi:hypothetical protein